MSNCEHGYAEQHSINSLGRVGPPPLGERGELTVVGRHALRGTMIPVLTTVGLQFGSLLGGAVVVESIFGLPGLGRLTVDAIQARDLPMIQGAILWIAVVFNLVNLVVDVLYVAVDPRIRYR